MQALFPQNVEISGIANHYLSVTAVGADRVTVNVSGEIAFFQPGDKILLIQMTGTTLPPLPLVLTNANRYKQAWNSAGRYEILQLDQVVGNEVIFTDNISRIYDAGEKIQIVRLVEGDNVKITGALAAQPWNGNTGGIVAIIGMDSVILEANIDVSNQGFRGGIVPDEDYTGGCRKDVNAVTLPYVLDTLYFLPSETNRSGNKGEGIISVSWPYTKGSGFAINGGGAGNGLYSGGAGGGNYRNGGDGGRQSTTCTEVLFPSWGGYSCIDLYRNNRGVIMGGGGGTGVKSMPTYTATNGGNGGGIVLIITGTLEVRNGSSISSNGQNVTASATGSGGGGGAGGSVLLDVTGYSGNLPVNIRGGNGGRTIDCTGPGGGGSGGVFWHSLATFTGINADTTRGEPPSGCLATISSPGAPGAKLKKLLTPLTGFLFNSIRGTDTLCEGQVLPSPLTGSQPKGGDGIYDFQWEQSTDNLTWNPASGTKSLRSLQPPALTQTTYYRRIVNSINPETFIPISDTSRTLKIYVYPAITGNTIYGTDTICYDLPARTLTGTNPSGGNGIFNYQWEFSTDQGIWDQGGTNNSYNPGPLQQSLYFRRLVASTDHCSNISNQVKITVLASITGNDFVTPDTVICENQGPGLLNAGTPANGDGIFSYQWQFKTLSGSWTTIPSSGVMRYNPGTLTDTTYYRRIVYSGNDQACKDTTAIAKVKRINVLPDISNNLPLTDASRYCAGEIPLLINGTQPLGGDNSYTYQWRIRTSGNWVNLPGANGKDYLPDQIVETNTSFSRIVTSGTYNACYDTSSAVLLDVVPYIVNDLSLPGQTICESNTPLPLVPSPASGGLGGITYEWINLGEGAPGWDPAPGANDQVSYAPGPLAVSTMYARKAFSDICSHISDTISITVYPAIGNNSILGGAIQYTCYNSARSLTGSDPVNGNGSYLYYWEQSDNNLLWTPAPAIPEEDGKNYTSNPLTVPKYFRRVVWSSPANHECADTSLPVEVKINPLPAGDVIHTIDTLCAGGTIQVKFNTTGVHPPFMVNIGGQVKTGINVSPDSMSFVPAGSQTYAMISVTDDSGCVADPAGFSEQAQAVVYDIPVASAGNDNGICSNTIMLQATQSVSGSVVSWSAQGAVFSDPSDPHSSVTVDQYGTNVFTWAETNWHCTDTDQVHVIFYEQPGTPDAGPDQVLDFIYTTQLNAITPVVGSGKWTVITGDGIFENDTLPESVVGELGNSTTLQWTVRNGSCPEVSDKMDIVITPLTIPKGFTPNGDTKNDNFDLGAVNAERIRIKIYNSAGLLVFESDNYLDEGPWDGKNMNGVEVPEGTYFYVADIRVAGREKEFQFRTFVEILR